MTKQEKAEREHMRKVYRLIRQLGMTSKYKGYYYAAEAVGLTHAVAAQLGAVAAAAEHHHQTVGVVGPQGMINFLNMLS